MSIDNIIVPISLLGVAFILFLVFMVRAFLLQNKIKRKTDLSIKKNTERIDLSIEDNTQRINLLSLENARLREENDYLKERLRTLGFKDVS